MFESLSNRLQDVFKTLRGEARLTEESVDAALRAIRLALLEADVNFRIVKAFVDRVRAKAVGDEVLRSLTPAQHVVRIVRDEMLALFGDAPGGLSSSAISSSSMCRRPAVSTISVSNPRLRAAASAPLALATGSISPAGSWTRTPTCPPSTDNC